MSNNSCTSAGSCVDVSGKPLFCLHTLALLLPTYYHVPLWYLKGKLSVNENSCAAIGSCRIIPGMVTIGSGSCAGADGHPCVNLHGEVAIQNNSCYGIIACTQIFGRSTAIGESSCLGERACTGIQPGYTTVKIGSNSCVGSKTCYMISGNSHINIYNSGCNEYG